MSSPAVSPIHELHRGIRTRLRWLAMFPPFRKTSVVFCDRVCFSGRTAYVRPGQGAALRAGGAVLQADAACGDDRLQASHVQLRLG